MQSGGHDDWTGVVTMILMIGPPSSCEILRQLCSRQRTLRFSTRPTVDDPFRSAGFLHTGRSAKPRFVEVECFTAAVADLTLPAIKRRSCIPESRHVNVRCTSRPAGGAIPASRPEPPLPLCVVSGGNESVNCHSADDQPEQLLPRIAN